MNISPSHLNLREMWQLHSLLKNGLEGTEKEYLIDTVSEMLDKLNTHEFVSALQLMYPKLDLKSLNPVELLTVFLRGVKDNNLFHFHDFVEGFANGSTKR